MRLDDGKIRVVQIGPVPPPYGGVSANMFAIHEALVRAGHDSVIVDVTNRAADRIEPFVVKPRSAMGLITTLAATPADIVHYHIGGKFTPKLAALTIYCGLLPGKRSVITFHSGGFARDVMSTGRPFSLRGAAFRTIDRLIGVNSQMIEMFKAYGVNGNRAKLILPFELRRPRPDTVVPERIESFAQRFDPLLLSIGALEPEYQNDLAIKALRELTTIRPNAGLLIVGSGTCEASLQRLVEESGLADRVLLAGNVDPDVALRLIERASVLLRITKYDGDSISIREALYLGTPVVASDNEFRPRGISLVPISPTISDLIEAILKAEKAQISGHSALPEAPSNAERVIKVYRELLGK